MKASQNSKNEFSFGDFYDPLRRDQESCTIIFTQNTDPTSPPSGRAIRRVFGRRIVLMLYGVANLSELAADSVVGGPN